MKAIVLIIVLLATIASAQTSQPVPGYICDLRGIVTDRAGKPIADAQIDLFTGGDNYEPPRPFGKIGETKSDANGRFVLKDVAKPAEEAPHIVRASAPGMGYAYKSGPMLINGVLMSFSPSHGPDAPDEAWLMLQPVETIRGRVIDEAGGAPVVGAEVRGRLPIDLVRTSENGEFAIDRATPSTGPDPGNRILTVHHPGFVIDTFHRSRHSRNVLITLRRGVLVAGRCTELASGEPVQGGVVTIDIEQTDGAPQYSPQPAWCDADGKFHVRLPANLGLVNLRPAVVSDNSTRSYKPTETLHSIITDTGERFEVNFTFHRLADVSPLRTARPRIPTTVRSYSPPWGDSLAGIKGTIVDEHGKPVSIARIEVMDFISPFLPEPAERPLIRECRSDASGKFQCKEMDSDQPLLIIARDALGAHVCQVVTEAGTREIDLHLSERTSKLTGVVRDEAANPVEGIPLWLRIAREDQPGLYVVTLYGATDSNGRYEINGYRPLPNGYTNWLIIGSPQRDWNEGPEQHVSSGESRYVHFPVKPGETLEGLDYTLVPRASRVAVPVREEFTRAP